MTLVTGQRSYRGGGKGGNVVQCKEERGKGLVLGSGVWVVREGVVGEGHCVRLVPIVGRRKGEYGYLGPLCPGHERRALS